MLSARAQKSLFGVVRIFCAIVGGNILVLLWPTCGGNSFDDLQIRVFCDIFDADFSAAASCECSAKAITVKNKTTNIL